MSKIVTIAIKCTGCGKKLVKDLNRYNAQKRSGQHNFYHKECVVKMKKRHLVFLPTDKGYGPLDRIIYAKS